MIRYSDFTTVTKNTVSSNSNNPRKSTIENLFQKQLYVLNRDPHLLLSYSIDMATFPPYQDLPEAFPKIDLSNNKPSILHTILNLGPYQYLLIYYQNMITGPVSLQMISKLTFLLSHNLSFLQSVSTSLSPLIIGEVREGWVVMSFMDGNPNPSLTVNKMEFSPCDSIDNSLVYDTGDNRLGGAYPFMSMTCYRSRCTSMPGGCGRLQMIGSQATAEGSIFTFSSQLAPRLVNNTAVLVADRSIRPLSYIQLSQSQYKLSTSGNQLIVNITNPSDLPPSWSMQVSPTLNAIRNQDYTVAYTGDNMEASYPPPPTPPSPALEATLTAGTVLVTAAPVVLITMNPMLAFVLATVLSNFTYLSLISGPYLSFCSLILKYILTLRGSDSFFQKKIRAAVKSDACYRKLPLSFVENDFNCNYLLNAGGDAVNLAITFVVSLLLSICGCIYTRRSNSKGLRLPQPNPNESALAAIPSPPQPVKPPLIHRAVTFVTTNYGLSYPLTQVYASYLQTLLACIVHFVFAGAAIPSLVAGLVVSILITTVCVVLILLYAITMRTLISRNIQDPKLIPIPYLSPVMEALPTPLTRRSMLSPILNIVRCLLIPLPLTLLASWPELQHAILIFMESAYLLSLCLIPSHSNPVDRLFGIVMIAFNIVYLSIKLISTVGNVDWVDGVLGWMLVGFFCLCILYTICLALYALNSLCKSKGKQPESSKSPEKKYQEKLPSSLTTVSTYRELSKMYEGNMDLSTSRLG